MAVADSGIVKDTRYRIWVDKPESFTTRRVTAVHHNFHEHPLMQLPQLAELAKELMPTKQCRFIRPGATQDGEFHHEAISHDGRTIDEVFRRIEETGSWVALYNVETVPRYAQFLREVTDSVRSLVDREQPGMFSVGGFIFISAPPSVTPFHIDRENNFWLQMHGQKVLNVWDYTDRSIVPASEVEQFICYGGLENVRLKPGFRERSHEFVSNAGDGVYFPSTSPHMTRSDTSWVKPGNAVSVSIGIVFYTDVTRREAYVYALNKVLRRIGLSPRSPGQQIWRDQLKYPLARALVWFQKRFRGYEPRVGM